MKRKIKFFGTPQSRGFIRAQQESLGRRRQTDFSDHILFSVRARITHMVCQWYEKNPGVPVCTFNTVTALNSLRLPKRPT